ncbi:glycosyltransferase family 1 protein [Mesorhizobium sp. M3A.F.Ca.ET.174.01.1.1]|uniref:glycosyltransferase n=1 Tax=unclassified Mesorhizobium TaxID=325217 RepID=UPI0010938BD2|nr:MULTISPECIES: glycosyltransferase [unclassified Mesorhizobium]TGS71790.1 glycosyltransferase family 1 protein [Mesorhizobium sp. M3A.F.Ca.ET.201.01.1.1]TGS87482.1 glycosyltransferase family 1 protein [Mesorhizobium sp. M3A.F.Ca.ET.175.01.1.1]TGT27942.1 glycosyltransferase family 1 protein [Mesorhizobium sp. M3A.F.Ca.ET.174.01.1.1]
MASILMVIESKIATTYLLEQIMGACREHGVDHEVKFLNELQIDDITPDTIPMFVRCADPLVLSWAQLLVDANRSYIYYIDDNFWRITGDNPLAVYYRHPIVRKSLEFAVCHAETVIVNSSELATFVSRFNTRVTMLPAFFDFSIIDGVAQSSSDEIRIGFAGSPSRVDDLDLIAPLIESVLKSFPKTVFEFAGVFPKGVAPGARVRFFPHTGDYATYIRFQASRNWAIGLAPLIDHEANRSKTDNKYREYSACRIAGIYSNIPPYRDVVKSDETGILVPNTLDGWFEALSLLIIFPEKRNRLADSAFAHVKGRYDLPAVSHAWANVFIGVDKKRSRDIKPLINWRFLWKKCCGIVERYTIHVIVTYKQGGLYLVTKRVVRRLLAGA